MHLSSQCCCSSYRGHQKLPFHFRQHIQFKISSLVRNCLTGSPPHTTSRPTVFSMPTLSLLYLVVPPSHLRLGATWLSPDADFYSSVNWNKLPQSFKDLFLILFDQFCKHLKTSLFVSEMLT